MSRRPSRKEENAPAAAGARAQSYTNRMGATFYLHEGLTKSGKPRYFVAKTLREGALAAMPEGYEFSESINAVVSVRRASSAASKVPDTDLAMVRAELARHEHLGRHRVEAVKDEILVYEPVGGFGGAVVEELARGMFLSPEFLEAGLAGRRRGPRYDAVMKFVPAEEPGHYAMHRMTYRGEGGWSWPLTIGPLRKVLQKYLEHLGTDEFFELN